ncbi:MAG: hypothetical protein GY931_13945 [Maribacter sp.]|nr:hypothetical protein [Maribacter sp.]
MINYHKISILLLIVGFALFLNSCELKKIETDFEICEHYNNADATIIQVTDQYFPANWKPFQKDSRKYSSSWAEFLAFKYNIPIHVFEYKIKGNEFKDFLAMGRGGASVYYPSCSLAYKDSILNNIVNELTVLYNKRPTTVSYGCGKTHYRDSLPKHILGGRSSSYIKFNSNNNNEISWYGDDSGHSTYIDFSNTQNIVSRPSNGRFYSDILGNGASLEDASLFVEEQVKKTVAKRGFYMNFMHWHDFYIKKETGKILEGVPLMKFLFKSMSQGVKNSNIAKLDYNEAIEYLYAKEGLVTAILEVMNDKADIVVRTETTREKDYSAIQTPITLRIHKDSIKNVNYKLFSISERIVSVQQDPKFIYFNIILDFAVDVERINISMKREETEIPNLWSQPSLKLNKIKNQVISSEPVRFTLFRKKEMDEEYQVEIVDRQYDLLLKYSLKKLDSNYNYFVGAIDDQNESSMIEISFANKE